MNHFDNEVATANYSIQDYDTELKLRRKEEKYTSVLTFGLIAFSILGLILSIS